MAFDYSKHVVKREVEEITILVDGEELLLKVRKLPWSKKNQIVSTCMSWDSEGNTRFDSDLYARECIKYVVVEAPWGETNDVFLSSIDGVFGRALQALVPVAFNANAKVANVEDVKKES